MAELGEKPELRWIKITQLYVDQSYQRSAKSKASRKNLAWMVENFSWAHCGALIVCRMPETGLYAVVDGQHRLLAAQARDDIPELPCLVVDGQDFQQQARNFLVVNTRRVKLNSLAAFHAAVAAGDPDAVAVREIADECGIEIPRTPVAKGETGPRQVQCVGTLVKMLGSYSRKQIVWALTIIPQAYGDETGQMRASIVRALAEFIKVNPDADRARMIGVLEGLDLVEIEQDARSYKAIKGGSTTDALIEVLTRHYRSAGRKAVA